MNKLVSTLLCGAFALTSLSVGAQEHRTEYLKIQTQDGSQLVKQGDSTILVASTDALTKTAASLWKVVKSDRATSGNEVYQFVNKTQGAPLNINGETWFAVGEKDNVKHQMDTVLLGETPASINFKTLFTINNNFQLATRTSGGFAVVDSTTTASEALKLVLAEAGDMTHWMSVAELNQCAKYQVPLFSQLEGIDKEAGAYEFVSASASPDATDTVFTIVNKDNKVLAVDSSNVTASSTVNLVDQSTVFGFNVKFDGDTKFNHFGILLDAYNDSIAVAVMDSILNWNVAQKTWDGTNTEKAGHPVAWLGNVRFVNDEVEFITVDNLNNSTNGKAYRSDKPVQLEAGAPLASGLYNLISKEGKVWGVPFKTVCNGGNAEATSDNTFVPENQWMVTRTFVGGVYNYAVTNRFYGDNDYSLAKISTCEGELFVFAGDTVTVKPVAATAGYKVFDQDALASSSFTLSLVNKLGAENVYMVMNADSSLNVLKTDKPLEFRAEFVAGKNFNNKTFATDTLANYNLFTIIGNDTLYVNGTAFSDNNKSFTLTTAKQDVMPFSFLFKAENETDYKLLLRWENNDLCSAGFYAIRVHENGGTTTYTKTTNNDVSLFNINEKLDDAEYARLAAGHYVIIENSKGTVEDGNLVEDEVLTKMVDKSAKFLSVGDKLAKDSTAIVENFSLWIDSACVSDKAGEHMLPTYYIAKDVKVGTDSLMGDLLTHHGVEKEMNFAADTVKINESMVNVTDTTANNTFLFKYTDVADQYTIHAAKDRAATLALVNGKVVLTKSLLALPVVVKRTSVIPTTNEEVAVEGVQVVAGNGVVTVLGAAGETVSVSNILGQTLAQQVLTSDNATIAVPAGVVVVKVANEAVKVVVK